VSEGAKQNAPSGRRPTGVSEGANRENTACISK
jgi:hypothetical protein